MRPVIGGGNPAGKPIVHIGAELITRSELDAEMVIEAHTAAPGEQTVPVPPEYGGCVSYLATQRRLDASSRSTRRRLRSSCASLRRRRLQSVLDRLIAGEWAIGAAAEAGVPVTEAEVVRRLEQAKARQFGSEAKFQAYLAQSDENVPDILFSLQVQLADQALLHKVEASIPAVGRAAAASYYASHRSSYALHEKRDIGIIRTNRRDEALRVKRQLQAGVSFATLVRRLGEQQPIYSAHDGLVPGLERHVFSERALDDAIFAAHRNVVTGPIRLRVRAGYKNRSRAEIAKIDGYYVFEVRAIHRARQETFAEAQSAIAARLPAIMRKRAITAFVAHWRASWRARTDCQVGYVVAKCRQSHTRAREDPDGLD